MKRRDSVKAGYIKIRGSNILDGFGFDLKIVDLSKLQSPDVSPNLRQSKLNPVIWSVGKNGTNEFGNGDDIFVAPK